MDEITGAHFTSMITDHYIEGVPFNVTDKIITYNVTLNFEHRKGIVNLMRCVFKGSVDIQARGMALTLIEVTFEQDVTLGTILKILDGAIAQNRLTLIVNRVLEPNTLQTFICKSLVLSGIMEALDLTELGTIKGYNLENLIITKLDFKTLNIHTIKCGVLNIKSRTDANQLTINSTAKIDEININVERFASIKTEGLIGNIIDLRGNLSGKLRILNSEFNQVRFENFQCNKNLNMSYLDILDGGILTTRDCELTKVSFMNCNFRMSTWEFLNTSISEPFLSQTDFPKLVTTDHKPNYEQAKLAFGQLSTAFSKQGDTIRHLEYQSREVEAHYNSISFRNQFWTKVNLWLNKWSNLFGRSWSRGIVFTCMIGLIFYYPLILSSEEYQFWGGFDPSWKIFYSYFNFINPIRSFELEKLFITGEQRFLTMTDISKLWDFVARIFIAYGYYQTIQAFRRYGRK